MRAHRIAGIAGPTLSVALFAACTAVPPPRPLPPAASAAALVDTSWPRPEVLALAQEAYACGAREGRFTRPVLTIVDFSLPSREPRLWVIDLEHKQVLHHELVAHGAGSGDIMALRFSNQDGSHESSLGLFRTEDVYTGKFGHSLRLSGLEPGFNDHAYQRAIVVHGFADVSHALAEQRGTIARSWGCLALPQDTAPQIIDSIAGGSAIFVYYPETDWLQQSHYLHCGTEVAGSSVTH